MVWNNRQQPNPNGKGKKVPERFSYSSGNNTQWLSVEEIRERLKNLEVEH